MSTPPPSEAFVLEVEVDEASGGLHAREIALSGWLSIFVRSGSQYATWRQFPMAVRYEVEAPSGEIRMTPDLSMSISEGPGVYEAYAREPADAVIRRPLTYATLLDDFPSLFEAPGRYRLRAHYLGLTSNWVEVELAGAPPAPTTD